MLKIITRRLKDRQGKPLRKWMAYAKGAPVNGEGRSEAEAVGAFILGLSEKCRADLFEPHVVYREAVIDPKDRLPGEQRTTEGGGS